MPRLAGEPGIFLVFIIFSQLQRLRPLTKEMVRIRPRTKNELEKWLSFSQLFYGPKSFWRSLSRHVLQVLNFFCATDYSNLAYRSRQIKPLWTNFSIFRLIPSFRKSQKPSRRSSVFYSFDSDDGIDDVDETDEHAAVRVKSVDQRFEVQIMWQ